MVVTADAEKRSNKSRRRATDAAADHLNALIGDILSSTQGVEFSTSAAGACMFLSGLIIKSFLNYFLITPVSFQYWGVWELMILCHKVTSQLANIAFAAGYAAFLSIPSALHRSCRAAATTILSALPTFNSAR